MAAMNLRAIVWDLDGTLIHSAPDVVSALNTALAEVGIDAFAEHDVRSMMGGGIDVLVHRVLARAGRQDIAADPLAQRVRARYAERPVVASRLQAGAEVVLERFAGQGLRQGLCSNKPVDLAATILERLGVARFFSVVVGAGTTPWRKPDPRPLSSCLQRLDVAPADAVLIGDGAEDVGAARAAGVRSVVVESGYGPEPQISLAGDVFIPTLLHLPSALLAIKGRAGASTGGRVAW